MRGVLHSNGTDATFNEYMDMQMRLMGAFSTQALTTGPEQDQLSGQQWKVIDRVRELGMEDKEMFRQFGAVPHGENLFNHWRVHFSPLVGSLSRVEHMPIEDVERRVGEFQSRVIRGLGELRHYTRQHVGELNLDDALQAVRWEKPQLDLTSLRGAYEHRAWHLVASTSFPMVVGKNGVYTLSPTLYSEPEEFAAPVSAEHIDGLQKTLADYGQLV